MKYKLYIIATIVALLVAVPVTLALDKQHNLLKIERSQNSELQLKIEREQKAKTQTEQKLQEEQKSKEQLEKENDKLKADLQAKLKRQEQEKIARAQQVTTPAVSIKAGGNCDAYQGLVAQYDWDVSTMMRIMRAESGCNPTNHNHADNHRSCLGSYGLFQIGCVHGLSVAYLSEPANNIASAYKIWQSQGYTAWTTY